MSLSSDRPLDSSARSGRWSRRVGGITSAASCSTSDCSGSLPGSTVMVVGWLQKKGHPSVGSAKRNTPTRKSKTQSRKRPGEKLQPLADPRRAMLEVPARDRILPAQNRPPHAVINPDRRFDLHFHATAWYDTGMNAAEIIAAIRTLPANERRQVELALRAGQELPPIGSEPSASGDQRVDWPDLSAWRREVFGDTVLPNPVLSEREEAGR